MVKILLVDDDKDILTLLGEYLNANSFEVETAYSSMQARHCLEHSEYHAVVSDFCMPGESGLDLLSYVLHRFPGLPFILMTGNHSARLKQEAMKMGSGYLEKPFELRELVKALRAVMAPGINEPEILDKTG